MMATYIGHIYSYMSYVLHVPSKVYFFIYYMYQIMHVGDYCVITVSHVHR